MHLKIGICLVLVAYIVSAITEDSSERGTDLRVYSKFKDDVSKEADMQPYQFRRIMLNRQAKDVALSWLPQDYDGFVTSTVYLPTID